MKTLMNTANPEKTRGDTANQPRGPVGLFVLGLLMAICGQYILLFPIPDFPTYALAEWLEIQLKLGMPNIEAQLFGMALLVAGCILIVNFAKKTNLLSPEFNPGGKIRIQISRKIFSSWGLAVSLALNVFLLVQLARQDAGNYLVVAWIASLIPVAVVAWQMDRQAGIQLSPNLKRLDVVVILLTLLAGLVFGAYRLEGVPNFLMGDEGSFWTTAKDITSGKYAPSAFDFGVYTYPILSSIFQAGVMKVAGVNLWGWRFSSVLAALMAVPPLYLLARELFDRKVATLSILVMVFSPYYLAFSRFGYNNSQTLLPVTLAITLGYLGIKRSSIFYLLLAGYAAGLGFYTYTAAQSGLVILGLFTFILLLQKKNQRKSVILAGLIILFGWYLVASPQRVYGLGKHPESFQVKLSESVFFNANYVKAFLPPGADPEETGSYFGDGGYYFEPKTWATMTARATIRSLFVFQTSDLVSEHMIAFPLAGTAGALFFMLGLIYSLAGIKERRNIALLAWFLVTITILSILNTFPPRQTHLVGMIPLIALWIGVGISQFARLLAHAIRPLNGPIGHTLTLAMLAASVAGFGLYDYFVKAPQAYLPQEENIINWAGLYNPNTRFFYVTPAGSEDFVPFAMQTIAPDIAYQTIGPESLPEMLAENGEQSAVFYFHPLRLEMADGVTSAWPQAISQTHTNREGNQILLAITNNPNFIFSVPYGFSTAFGDTFRAPAIWLMIFILALAILTAFLPRSWLTRLPPQVNRLTDWLSESPKMLPIELESEPVKKILSTAVKVKKPEPDEIILEAEQPALLSTLNDRAKPEKESKQRLIEIEFKIRINLGGGVKELTSRNSKSIKQIFNGWVQKLSQGIVQKDWPASPIESAAFLVPSFSLAILAQFFLNSKLILPGVLLYAAAAVILLNWFQKQTSNPQAILDIGKLHAQKEWLLLLVVLAIGIFARTYQAGNFPYGIEGDEAKWGLQAFYSTIMQVRQGVFGHHFEDQPVSFYLIGLAMRLFEIDLFSPRYLNAFLSSLSLVLFYFGLRRATSQSVALVGTFLYATSFTALSAGRQALHDTYIEIWINLAFLSLVSALESRKTWQMLITGIALALGSLTYETFYPVLIVFLLYTIIKLFEYKKKEKNTLNLLIGIIFPVSLIAPKLISYVLMRQDHHLRAFRTLTSEINPENPTLSSILTALQLLGQAAQTLFVSITYPDSLTRWPGPIVNPWILPFFFVGLIIAVRQIRQKHNLLLVLWFLIGFFGFSMLGAVYPRVLFAALMPVYALAAMGLIAALNVLRSLSLFSFPVGHKQVLTGFTALLIILANYDVQIFYRLPDAQDRQQRRELYDTFAASLRSSPLTILPYTLRSDSVAILETEILNMLALGIFDMNLPKDVYNIIPIDQAMPTLWLAQDKTDSATLIADKTSSSREPEYQQALETLLACYPQYTKTEGVYFDSYTFSDLQQPKCFSLFPPEVTSPTQGQALQAGQPVVFNWDVKRKDAKCEITVQTMQTGVIRLEAEDMLADGWYPEDKHAPDYSGIGYLTDNLNSGLAKISFEISEPGSYSLWVRTYRRVINDQVNYLALDSNPATQISQGGKETFNTWVWEKIGPYTLEAGQHTITASRTYGSDPQFSVFLDAFVISPNPDYHPEESDLWVTIFSSAPQNAEKTSYTYSRGLPPGKYRWWVAYAEKTGLVNWFGASGINAEPVEFSVNP